MWEPGSPVELGDYGTLQDGVFQRLGPITDFVAKDPMNVDRSKQSSLEFMTVGTRVGYLGAGGEQAETLSALVGVKAEMRITFTRENSLYVKSASTWSEEIGNLQVVSTQLRANNAWNFSWVLVSSVRKVTNLALLLSSSKDSTVSVKGSLDALKAFDLGNVDAGFDLRVAGDASYKCLGTTGPFLLKLVRLRRILGGVTRAASPGGLAVKAYEEIDPTTD